MHLDGQELWRWPFQKRKGWVPGEDQKRLGLTDNEVILRGLPKGKGVPSGHRHTGDRQIQPSRPGFPSGTYRCVYSWSFFTLFPSNPFLFLWKPHAST